MATAIAQRCERLEARVTTEQKELLQRAAALEGESLTEFVVGSARRAAEETIRNHEVLTLSPRESAAFVDALLNPRGPNQALRDAAEHYRRVMGRR